MAFKTWHLASIFLSLSTYFTYVTTQDLFSVCYQNGDYENGSLYKIDLETLLSSLSLSMPNNGFYNASTGEVNAVALCRADVQLSQCRGCVNIVAQEIVRQCPNKVQAVTWQQYCMVLYSNESVSGKLTANETGFELPVDGGDVEGGDEVDKVRGVLIQELRAKAAGGGALRKAAAGNRTTAAGNHTVYAMVQCRPDLSPENCTACLVNASGYFGSCCLWQPASGYIVYMPSCSIHYEVDRLFYDVKRLQEPLELSTSPSSSPPGAGTRDIIIIVISIVVFLIVAFFLGFFVMKRLKQKKKGEPKLGEDGYDEIINVESIQLDFGKIRAATNDFSDAKKLGEGGFGKVYKGKLEGKGEIAVKRLSKNSCQGDAEFKNEVMLLLARLQHRNLVRLLGFSLEGAERVLVYEFVQNGSLNDFIFDPDKSSNLDWKKRYKIIVGIARGLIYLHEDSTPQIIHGDLKASNVLLDEDMSPKISDFGLARLVEPAVTHESTSRNFGTYGNIAPEYASHGRFSIKSDVFSFGILVLEIVTGRNKTCFQTEESSKGNLLSHAWRSWREGTMKYMIDPALMSTSEGDKQEMLRCIHIALLCVQNNPDDRLKMADVVLLLNTFSITLPLPSEPGFYIPSSFSKATSASQGPEYNSSQIFKKAI